jgi:hypothetical protein
MNLKYFFLFFLTVGLFSCSSGGSDLPAGYQEAIVTTPTVPPANKVVSEPEPEVVKVESPVLKATPKNVEQLFVATLKWRETGVHTYEEDDVNVMVNLKDGFIVIRTTDDNNQNSSNTLWIENVSNNVVDLSGNNFNMSLSTVFKPKTWERRPAKSFNFTMEVVNGIINYVTIGRDTYYSAIPKPATERIVDKTRQWNSRHTVKRGETLERIAKKHGMLLGELLRLNPQIVGDRIYPGEEVRID